MAEIKSKVSRDLARFLINRFLKPEMIQKNKGNFTFWPREIKIIGQLFTKYPNEEFWITLNITFFLNSFAYFKTGDGENELEKQWRLFCVDKKINQFEVDKKANLPILELDRETVVEKKSGPVQWADS